MQVLQEVFRCSLAVTFAGKIDKHQDRKIRGYTVPKNTPMVMAAGVASYDERYFPDPERFVIQLMRKLVDKTI